MKTRIVRIGNSRGIRLPKPLLERTGLGGEVVVIPQHKSLVIRSAAKARDGWDEAFAEMARHGDDVLLDADVPLSTAWDETEWTW
jgi:antitoxin MazE